MMTIAFGSFALDDATRQLTRDGEVIPVPPKAFDLLAMLIAERPRVVAKAEILERLWPGTYVADTTLAGVIAELRGALADDARNPRFIRTVHRIGYAFCGDADAAGEPPRGPVYRLTVGDRQIQLQNGPNVLGRDRTAALWIDHPSISRRHAVIVIDRNKVTLEDLGSKNGTFLHGRRIEEIEPLADGDDIRLGNVSMVFQAFVEGMPTESVT